MRKANKRAHISFHFTVDDETVKHLGSFFHRLGTANIQTRHYMESIKSPHARQISPPTHRVMVTFSE